VCEFLSNLADRLSASSADFAYAVIGDDAALLGAIRQRIDELGITHQTLEAISGVTDGYVSKVLGNPPQKRIQLYTVLLLIEALGLEIRLFERPDLVERYRHRYVKRKLARPSKNDVAAPPFIS
jgi:hypothetical protein